MRRSSARWSYSDSIDCACEPRARSRRGPRDAGGVHDRGIYPRILRINTRRRSARTPKAPLPYSAIERALPTYGQTLPDLRAKALVTLAFSTMLRRSELVALEVTDFKPTPDAQDGTIRLRSSKADQAGHGAERYVSP